MRAYELIEASFSSVDEKPLADGQEEAFDLLADDQRGLPERAMLVVQHASGSGVLNFVVEHVGDITHRMSEKFPYLRGSYGTVKDKVEKTLRALTSGYGFAKEHNENMVSNSRYRKIPLTEYKDKIDKALRRYEIEHSQLKVYNEPQKWARDAAIALGAQDWDGAILYLSKLKNILQDEDQYKDAVSQYNPQGFKY